MAPATLARRADLLKSLFPGGAPALWCPLLTHYQPNGDLDRRHIEAHLRHLAPHLRSFLIPGSTGDGWVLGPIRTQQLIDLLLDLAQRLDLTLLLGVLRPSSREMLDGIQQLMEVIRQRTGENNSLTALTRAHVAGFTICPPHGADERQLAAGLASILETGLPIALYQLPQVTRNEISPELAADLAARFENFIMLKDTSGADRIVLSGKPLDGVFTVRGAEGNYARWLERAGGPYQGFLLSTANCFARELRQIIDLIAAGKTPAAIELSDQLTRVIDQAFKLTRELPVGNPFANANKAMDHFFAYGQVAVKVPPPRLYTGDLLPVEVLVGVERILSKEGLLPVKGYLD